MPTPPTPNEKPKWKITIHLVDDIVRVFEGDNGKSIYELLESAEARGAGMIIFAEGKRDWHIMMNKIIYWTVE